jgi:amino acid transporter
MRDMQPQNHGLKRELKLRDLVLMQVLLVLGPNLAAYAAKQGPSQVVLWLLAMAFFYLPQAGVVIALSRAIPLEGGVYQWVKLGISPFAGYMAGWCFSLYIVCFFASFGSQVANGLAYVGGNSGAWMGTSKPFTLSITIAICVLAFVLNVRGLHVTKWLSGVGSVMGILVVAVVAYLLVKSWMVPGGATARSNSESGLAVMLPGLSLMTLNVFTKMAMFALSGIDQCSIFSEECRKPKNDVARSVFIAAPLIALMYIVVTSCIQAYIPLAQVDVAAPVSQAMQVGFGPTALGRALMALAVAGFTFALVSAFVVVVGMVARLPMAAGWDGLLPDWWSALNPRFKTPAKAIAVVAGGMLLMGALSLFGAGNQEAVQVLAAVGFGSYCIMYMLLFGAVIFGFRSSEWRPSLALRLGALAAFAVVVISFAFELIPLGEVASPLLFAMKVAGAICATTGMGAYLYWRGTLRVRRLAMVVEG